MKPSRIEPANFRFVAQRNPLSILVYFSSHALVYTYARTHTQHTIVVMNP